MHVIIYIIYIFTQLSTMHINYETDALKLNIWTNSIYIKVLYSALFARDIITKCIINNLMGMGLSINTVRLMVQIICVKMVAL